MKVFELLVDFDGTTRSSPASFGLYENIGRAEHAFKKLSEKYGKALGGYSVTPRIVR